MSVSVEQADQVLKDALSGTGQRFTEQRASVFRHLVSTESHPTADDVFLAVRNDVPGISLATVYKSLETLVGVGLAKKLTYGDGSARYDGRTDPHHHIRCLSCGKVRDVPGRIDEEELRSLGSGADGFEVTGFRVEVVGYCAGCGD